MPPRAARPVDQGEEGKKKRAGPLFRKQRGRESETVRKRAREKSGEKATRHANKRVRARGCTEAPRPAWDWRNRVRALPKAFAGKAAISKLELDHTPILFLQSGLEGSHE